MSYTNNKEIDNLLNFLLSNLQKILQNNLIGFYLYGSLAIGDFDPNSSDIDFVVITKRDINEEEFNKLEKMHTQLKENRGWGKKLEGGYFSRDAIKKYDPKYRQPFLSEVTPFSKIQLDYDWVLNRQILRGNGVAIYGPNPKNLIDSISKEEIKKAAKNLLCNSWGKHIDGPKWMYPKKVQAFTILTLCRAFYAKETGDLISKSQAAKWAFESLDKKWHSLVRWALDNRHDLEVDIKTLPRTLEFLKFVIVSNC